MRPKLTIITPSLNQGAFLERAIQSVLDQGYENLEYVIVDGGSTDGSVEIIKRYEDRLAWWVSVPDEGQSDAINAGLAGTTGEVVAYLNSDDYYLPGAFNTAIAALQHTNTGWVAGAAKCVDEHDRPVGVGVWQPTQPSEWELWFRGRHWWTVRTWCVPQPSAFWRRRLFDEYGPFRRDMHFAFDAEFFLRLVFAGELPELVPDVLSARVSHPAQKSRDMKRWDPERERIVNIFRSQLTARERRRLAVAQALDRAGVLRAREILWRHALPVRIRDIVRPLAPQALRPSVRRRNRSA
jgi:glycosyltransferase involved in cell wall biosynthesis